MPLLAHSGRPSPRIRTVIARPARSDWLFLLLLGVIWGTSYAFIKLGGQSLPTFTLIATRLGIGFALLAAVVAVASRCRGTRRPTATSW